MIVLTVAMTVATGFVLWGLFGSVALFALSRVDRRSGPQRRLRFVFVVPALNEGSVIGATVRHLLAVRAHGVVVVDDGSDDDTAAQVRAVRDPRVTLIRRTPPEARQGKGAALNTAYQRVLRSSKLGRGLDPDDVVLCVVDADGRLDERAIADAESAFADPKVGACQVAVRIRNKRAGFWTAMQHFEFVAYAFLYQRGREWTGSVGLGGNGQFVRLSALRSLGDAPWSSCLTEDMDLGIRLLLAGWRNRFLSTCWVSQQAIPDARRLLRQRTRWFQGTLQCIRHLAPILGSRRLPLVAKIDLAGILLTPVVMLALSPFMILGVLALLLSVPTAIVGLIDAQRLVPIYVMALIVPLMLAFAFWRHEPGTSAPRAFVAGHLFAAYGFLWPLVGWSAAARHLRGRSGWVRTPRVEEPELDATPIRGAA